MSKNLAELAEKITTVADYPTQTEMKRYYSGEMSAQEMHAIELKLDQCEFSKEAFEGLAMSSAAGNLAAINSINKAIGKKIAPFYVKTPFLIGAGLAIGVGLFFAGFQFNKNQVEQKMVETQPVEMEKPNQKISLETKEIVAAVYLPEQEQIKPIEAKKEVEKIEEELILRDTTPVISMQPKVSITRPKENEIQLRKPHYPTMMNKTNFRVVNYRGMYRNSISRDELNLTGLEPLHANDSNLTEQNEAQQGTTQYIAYNDFLTIALEKFKRTDYKSALQDFLIILKHYPEDLNAKFYGGLCYYNINKPEAALNYFEAILNGASDNFNQEAKWYKALSLIKLDEPYNAKVTLKEIIEANQFYSKRAKEKLKQIDRL